MCNSFMSYKSTSIMFFIIFLLLMLNGCVGGSDGDQGPQGEQGSQGQQGEQGSTGAQGPQGLPGVGVYDKQIRFEYDFQDFLVATNTSWVMSPNACLLTKFNIENYIGVNRIVFSAAIESANGANNCFVELYDLTNDVPISQSTVQTNSTTVVWVDTINIFSQFPDEEITLGVRIRSEINGIQVRCRRVALFLYRD